jgi:hypothetical protein
MHRAIISHVPFLKGAGDAFIADVVTRMRPVQASAGDLLIRAGEVGGEMYIVDSGCAACLPRWLAMSAGALLNIVLNSVRDRFTQHHRDSYAAL